MILKQWTLLRLGVSSVELLCPLKIYSARLEARCKACMSLKSGLPLINDAMWKMRPSTTLSISLKSSWSREHVPSLRCHLRDGRCLWQPLCLCVFSSATVIAAGGPPLFLLLSSRTGLLNLKAVASSILLSASLYPVLLSKDTTPLSLLCFILQRNNTKTVILPLKFMHRNESFPRWKLSFPRLG